METDGVVMGEGSREQTGRSLYREHTMKEERKTMLNREFIFKLWHEGKVLLCDRLKERSIQQEHGSVMSVVMVF